MALAFYVCTFCRVIACSSKSCESPKEHCQRACLEAVNENNVYYEVCRKCLKSWNSWLRREVDGGPFNPPKLEE